MTINEEFGLQPKLAVAEWDDEPIRPSNADTTIGWAGVPLSETLGYYGHIQRATLPTNEQLGFVPEWKSVDVKAIATAFVEDFAQAIETRNFDAIVGMIAENGYWKDVEMLTWDIRSLRGHDKIRHMLQERLSKTGITKVALNSRAPPILETVGEDLSFILLHFEFEFAHGTGVGVARLSPCGSKTGSASALAQIGSWRAYTIGTSIETVRGWDAEYGDKIRYQPGKVHDPLGKGRTYRGLRQAEMEEVDPTVVLIGAGHSGLCMAARFKVLGIPHLIIEKGDSAGHSWASRYDSLSLHGPTYANHMPCVPFPHWFPTFLPAQQLAAFMRHYAAVMDLNIWTKTVMDGRTATYDEAEGKWTITVTRADGRKQVLRPRHLIICTGISGTDPAVPDIPGLTDFEKNGGLAVHSSRHKTGPEWKGKRCLIVGAATSAHDLAYELVENGCSVTMIQRSATHVISVDRSVRTLFSSREKTNRAEGQPLELVDQAVFLKQPYPVEYEILPRGQEIARRLDQELYESLNKVGYRLHDGYHGGGAYAMFQFDQGGFYWDTGACKLISEGKIKLTHSEVECFTQEGVVFKDGTREPFDAVVFATGYMKSQSAIQALLGDSMAKKCHERWEKGNAMFLGPEGDSIINYCPLPQKGLWSLFHQFSFSRFHSARLALRIKAEELGIDVTPYGNKPLGPPSTAAGRQPRPEGVPI